MDLVLFLKIIFGIFMFLSSLAVGMLPIFIPYFRKNSLFASIGNTFSAGIFLAVAMIHILPEANQKIEKSISDAFPLGYFLCVVGYGLILFIQKVAFSHSHNTNKAQNSSDRAIQQKQIEQQKEQRKNDKIQSQKKQDPLLSGSHSKQETINAALTLAVALSVHSIIEGIAVGLEDSVTGVINVASAIMVHKLPAALALGINMIKNNKKQAIILIIVFGVASPLGIGIGIILESVEEPILIGIFLSICAGTFLYISCSQVIVEEFAVQNMLYLKYIGFLVGFGTFTVLTQIISDGD